MSMHVTIIDPLQDPRWPEFVDAHPSASIFHARGWLSALKRTYGYTPCAYATVDGQTITGALVFCSIKSWLTGSRIISLPFSDHCQPLVTDEHELRSILGELQEVVRRSKLKYLELRPVDTTASGPAAYSVLAAEKLFYFHQVDLRPALAELFARCHKNGVQKMIERGQREKLEYEEGQSDEILKKFYQLLLLTRRKHGLPPQPLSWFKNLVDNLREQLRIHVVSKNGVPVASILMLRHKKTLTYKYGCSDSRFNNLGGTPFLLWTAIRQAKESGAEQLDLGRSDIDNTGLITFKSRWGAASSQLCYYRYPLQQPSAVQWKSRAGRWVLGQMPSSVLSVTANLLYRHVG